MSQVEICRSLAHQGVWCIPESALPGEPEGLEPIGEGFYLNPYRPAPLFALQRLAGRLRPDDKMYLSLESVLSECGWISQMPFCLTILTDGQDERVSTRFGDIMFIHTDEAPSSWLSGVQYSQQYNLLVATPEKALEDLVRSGQNLDLVISEELREE